MGSVHCGNGFADFNDVAKICALHEFVVGEDGIIGTQTAFGALEVAVAELEDGAVC